MANQPSSKKSLAVIIAVMFLVMTLVTGVLAVISSDRAGVKQENSSSDLSEASENESGDGPADDIEELPVQEEEPPEPEEEPVFFNVPNEMRGVMLVAGRDFMTSESDSEETLASQIDTALTKAKELGMNSIIIDTKYYDDVLFTSSVLPMAPAAMDCTRYITDKAREMDLYVYASYDVSDISDSSGNHVKAASADGDTLDMIAQAIGEFVETYEPDGVLLNNYYNQADEHTYANYNQNGGGIGYYNYLRQVPQAMITTAKQAVRSRAPGTQVGLLADAVWENNLANPMGSQTETQFTALGIGNADTKLYVEQGLVDFVMVKNFGSTTEKEANFTNVAQWWADTASEAGIPVYMMHAVSKAGSGETGWYAPDELTQQVIAMEKIGLTDGSAFDSLKALSANVGSGVSTMLSYMNDQIEAEHILTQLALAKPALLEFKTKEPTVTFSGASDPTFEVTLNGEKIPTNENGYFTILEDLQPGLNTFKIAHKGRQYTYNITRDVQILKEITPVGSINVDGGMAVSISALAYENATVSATINGQTVPLTISEKSGDDTDRDSQYKLFTGTFTAPSASQSAVKLGNIVVSGTSEGTTMSLEGATVTVNKKAELGDGSVVQVIAEQAETFPVKSLNDNSSAAYYPLPKGTVDMTYGDEIIYKDGKKTYSYWKLQSGVRVYSSDITTGGSMPDNNGITGMSIKSSGAYTTVRLTTGQKIPYLVEYNGSQITFKFQYTSTVPKSQSLSNNLLFTDANWDGSNLTLKLKRSGGFLGYKAYYEDSELVFRFNNSPGGLSGARIVVDPGHGGDDPGALGFYPGQDEKDINLAVAKKLVAVLQDEGATVKMLSPGTTMADRMATARAFNPQVLVSIHCNSSVNSSATGSESYYFYSFQKALASNVSSGIAKALNTDNRGGKSGLYYMTRESQFACTLAELGFLTNEDEYTRLISSKTQTKIANGIANAINSYLAGVGSGGGSYDEDEEEEDYEDEESEESGNDGKVTDITLDDSKITIQVDETYRLDYEIEPSNASNQEVTWSSSNKAIATVSSSGRVTGIKEGTCKITVKTRDGGYTDSCTVTVGSSGGNAKIQDITISGSDTVEVGKVISLTAKLSPSNADPSKVSWESGDTSIATVTSSGKVKGVKEGTVKITALADDGGDAYDRITITVKASSGSSSGEGDIVLDSSEVTMDKGDTYDLFAEVSGNFSGQVVWKSKDTDVVTVKVDPTDSRYATITGVGRGWARITASSSDGKYVAYCEFTIE